MSAFATLRGFAQKPTERTDPAERCEMCASPVSQSHRHLLDPISRSLLCTCDTCAALFDKRGDTKYKTVPGSGRLIESFALTDSQWESLLIPIGLAFFVKSSVEGRVLALYPSPAGSTESLLPLDAWAEIVAANPLLASMESDVEALLVNRLDNQRPEYYIAPIDQCYELV